MARLEDKLYNRDIVGKLSEIASLEVGDVKSLTSEQINSLHCGDIVAKKDESGNHAYIVSYKKDGTGICLTYTDASCVETVSYDLVDGEWVYNSTDITPLSSHIGVIDDIEDSIEVDEQVIQVQGLQTCFSDNYYEDLIGCSVTITLDTGQSYPVTVMEDGLLQWLDIGANLTSSCKIVKIVYIKVSNNE